MNGRLKERLESVNKQNASRKQASERIEQAVYFYNALVEGRCFTVGLPTRYESDDHSSTVALGRETPNDVFVVGTHDRKLAGLLSPAARQKIVKIVQDEIESYIEAQLPIAEGQQSV